ncbi:MAG TPA: RNA polymerase sigma factor [Thermoanaerobaculia bacterium]|nr:RNA polymerase sigma factor [Thermoanaerobaculia bacterium]
MPTASGHGENTSAEDRLLLERIRRGDTDGAAELFERYAPALLRFADRLLSDRAQAEEVSQEVFVKVISRAHQYDGRAEVSSWLFAIAANACRDRRRRDRRAPVVPIEALPEPAARGEGVERALMDRERRDSVRRALAELSEEQREALVLARYHGLPYAEIATVLGISVGAVKTRIFRAVETLKARFSEGAASWNAAN